jgi:predicted Zn-dependent peptidase
MIKRFTRNSCFHYSVCLLLLGAICGRAGAQTVPEPDRQQLLNGLNVVFWQQPGDANVLVKLRIRSGAAFDLAGKDGTMALLGDALFPDPATREYVTEQLGGKLEVSTDFDRIDVTISGKASEFERIVDLLRAAVVTTQLTPENVSRLRESRIKQLSETPVSAAELADRAIAARLFGSFPYGRTPGGTLEGVAKIERADLMLARERFLNADNATLVVIGGIEKSRTLRTLRQLIGPWRKSDRSVPATFRQPLPPDARVLVVNQTGATSTQIRLAVRGLAYSDRDTPAASLLAQIVQARWQTLAPDLSATFARHEAHALPGAFVMGGSVPNASVSKALAGAQQVLRALAQNGPTAAELEAALSRRPAQPDSFADRWLDIDTYNLAAKTDADSIRGVTVADLQRAAARLFKDASIATVLVGDSEQLKATLAGSFELQPERPATKTASDPVVPIRKP